MAPGQRRERKHTSKFGGWVVQLNLLKYLPEVLGNLMPDAIFLCKILWLPTVRKCS